MGPPRWGGRCVSPLRRVVFCVVVRPSPPVLRSGLRCWEDLVVTLLGVGDDGGWLLRWRRVRLLCWLESCVLIPGPPFR